VTPVPREERPEPVYERIGVGYGTRRVEEPRWRQAIEQALGAAEPVVNVGAGSGSYEPRDRGLVAVEPSRVMLDQRPAGAAPAVQAVAEALPFADGRFQAALAVLTVHHWSDPQKGLDELRRVAPRQVVVTWDRHVVAERFWLTRDYLPEALERERDLPAVDEIAAGLGPTSRVSVLEVPHDCRDGFFAAYWRRPEAYLDPTVRRSVSALALTDRRAVDRAVEQLRRDLADGTWHRRYADLLERDSLDLGYRLVVAGPSAM
jgi:SAM-dependent methyltransferase